MPNKDPLLTPEEFKEQQNNFYLHFVGEPGTHLAADVYRGMEPYQRCMAAHPEEFQRLASALEALHEKEEAFPSHSLEYEEKLYEAYTMMYPYADTNWALFR